MRQIPSFFKSYWVLILAIFIPATLLFRTLFSGSSMSLGDAPFFSKELPLWFLSEPLAWTNRGVSLGGLNQFIWIWPYMSLISAVEKIFSLESWVTIRLFFYIPSLLLAATGAFVFARSQSLSKIASFYVSLFSIFNTYYLTIFDGGQVGIVLAYAFFPWCITALNIYASKKITKRWFLGALIPLCILTICDPRIAIIAVVTSFLFNIKSFKKYALLTICWLLLNAYWLYPLLTIQNGLPQPADSLQLTSLLNGLFFYAPHWYQNIYGVITYPSILFAPFLILLVGNIFVKSRHIKSLFLIYLLFVFLIKGTADPFGFIYAFLVKIPFGSAFRDSTKFFIPAIYLGGILIGNIINLIYEKVKSPVVLILFYVLFLIPLYPTFLGRMNFVLSGRETNETVPAINESISDSKNTERVVWFPETDPRSVDDHDKESLSAKDLINLRLFSSMNVGTDDKFNFLNNTHADWWFDLLNIENLAFINNPRVITPSKTETEDKMRLNTLLPNLTYIKKDRNLALYKNSDFLPKMYGVSKLFVVVGSDSIYEKLASRTGQYIPYNQAYVFPEDGKWDPKSLSEYATESAIIVNNSDDKNAFAMSFMQPSFQASRDASGNQFAVYSENQYLQYKYELLIRKIAFDAFDFNKGISFSDHAGEEMNFNVVAQKDADYAVSVRSMTKNSDRGLHVLIDGEEKEILLPNENLTWTFIKIHLTKGNHTLVLKNESNGTQIFNVLSVLPLSDYDKNVVEANNFMTNIMTVEPDNVPISLLTSPWQEVPNKSSGSSKYIINPLTTTNWIVWTNNFNSQWRITRDFMTYPSLPDYSSVNVLYKRPGWSEMTLEFAGQDSVRFGIYYSIISVLAFIIIMLCL